MDSTVLVHKMDIQVAAHPWVAERQSDSDVIPSLPRHPAAGITQGHTFGAN